MQPAYRSTGHTKTAVTQAAGSADASDADSTTIVSAVSFTTLGWKTCAMLSNDLLTAQQAKTCKNSLSLSLSLSLTNKQTVTKQPSKVRA